MNTLMLVFGLHVNLVEIILFQLGAAIFGFAIHFFISSKKRFTIGRLSDSAISEEDQARLKFYEDFDRLNDENEQLRQNLEDTTRAMHNLEAELEELQQATTEKTATEMQQASAMNDPHFADQSGQPRQTQADNTQQVQILLEKIALLQGAEQKHLEAIRENEQLNTQLRDLRRELTEKETQIRQIGQQYSLSRELQERMDKAYTEFNLLQDKIQRLETYIAQPQHRSFDFEELQQSYFKMSADFEELKLKFLHVVDENQRITRLLAEAEDKLQEAIFQRQQLTKKSTYLENLNNDLQKVAEHNKKLENQLRRIDEIKTMLSKLSGAADLSEDQIAD